MADSEQQGGYILAIEYFSLYYTIILYSYAIVLCFFFSSVPPTVIPQDSRPIGVETRDGSPSLIRIGFFITRAIPSVPLENRTWTYTNLTSMVVLDVEDLVSNGSKYELSLDRQTLTIYNISLFDAGLFTLSATNEVAMHNATLNFIVHGKFITLLLLITPFLSSFPSL